MATKKIEALLPLIRFDLPYREGMKFEIEEKQANELIEMGYAKEASKVEDVPVDFQQVIPGIEPIVPIDFVPVEKEKKK